MVLAQVHVAFLVPVGRFVLELKKPASILSNTFTAHRQYTDKDITERNRLQAHLKPQLLKTMKTLTIKNPIID